MSKGARDEELDSRTRDWCAKVAALVADALITAGVVTHSQLERTAEVTTEEIHARLCVRDYPPGCEPR